MFTDVPKYLYVLILSLGVEYKEGYPSGSYCKINLIKEC